MASSARLQLAAEGPGRLAVTLVDSSVLLDILTDDPTWADWAEGALADARDAGELAINPIIYAEVSAGFDTIEDLDDALPATDFTREPSPIKPDSSPHGLSSRTERGAARRSPIPDFYIGAHAAVNRYRLVTVMEQQIHRTQRRRRSEEFRIAQFA